MLHTETVDLRQFPARDVALDAFARDRFDRVIAFAKPFADQGDAQMQYMLGVAYALALPQTLRSGQDSARYIQRAAENGNPYAQWSMGSPAHCRALNSCDNADDWQNQARAGWAALARQGNAQAMYFDALVGESWINYVPWFSRQNQLAKLEKAAEAGSKSAIAEWMLRHREAFKNEGGAALVNKAIAFLTPLAEKNNDEAMKWLAQTYHYYVTPPQIDKSIALWKKMEERGGVNLGYFLFPVYLEMKKYKESYIYIYSVEYKKNERFPHYKSLEENHPDIFTPEVIKALRAQAMERVKQIVAYTNGAGYQLRHENDVNYFPAGWGM
ncbi:hypothetical protein QCD60_10275 [Pokkaliibacter sp. MBI-7]|uniref:hypothetical protein n=1 Tax=Pokkaliibacter sp. MBI-7 TaxID=3040600 RepID=UPI002448FEA0|nr:hypothetical protein [Pokkaliibacter sp. MBI-7]MDH2432952.1 hypothetical protein [Pokkaliibacter sp. MBI-7]